MAQRLGQVLERIGAQVEILVSERVGDQAEGAPESNAPLGVSRGTVGKGLPPPSPEALVQQPSNTQTAAPALVPRARAHTAGRSEAMASLPEPTQRDDGSTP